MNAENPNIINLETPYREGAPGYLNLIHRLYSELGGIIAHETSDQRFRINMMTDLMINAVVVDEIQDKLREFKEAKISENIEKFKSSKGAHLGAEDMSMATYNACMLTIGMIGRYTNMYLGVSKKLSVIIEDPVTELKESDE